MTPAPKRKPARYDLKCKHAKHEPYCGKHPPSALRQCLGCGLVFIPKTNKRAVLIAITLMRAYADVYGRGGTWVEVIEEFAKRGYVIRARGGES